MAGAFSSKFFRPKFSRLPRHPVKAICSLLCLICMVSRPAIASQKPNIIFILAAFLLQPARAPQGVIRESAALAPKPEAVALAPLFDATLTDTSITVGPDKAFYLTGSAMDGQSAVFTNRRVALDHGCG